MPPHQIFGLSWAEIASILGVMGLIYGGARSLIRMVKESIAKPISFEMGQLRKTIDDLTKNSLVEHNTFDTRLDKHDIRLGVHDAEIGTLYSEVGLHRKTSKEGDKYEDN